jgi:hypothetical protein
VKPSIGRIRRLMTEACAEIQRLFGGLLLIELELATGTVALSLAV